MSKHHVLSSAKNGDAQLVGEGVTEHASFTMVTGTPDCAFSFAIFGDDYGDWCTPTAIKGEIYDVDDQMLLKLDQLEQHPDRYQRHKLNVQTVASSAKGVQTLVEVFMYVLHRPENKVNGPTVCCFN